ncbi:hypothetical protein NW765_011943 [Fusarium oxysporum]|nr:hypothetical protein NW765_011943 [Fusarium oxysporum]
MIAAILRIGRDISCLVGDLEPTTVNLIDVNGVDSLALARTNVDQDDLENIADTVGLLDESLATRP